MSNNKDFKVKNGIKPAAYQEAVGTATSGSVAVGYDLSVAAYDSVEFSIVSQDTSPRGMTFNNDGTKMYIVGSGNDSVFQYSLSTGFDLSTASYDSVSFSVASQDTTPIGLSFNNDGTKMYIIGNSSNTVYQYSLSTGFNLSTASYDSVSFSVSSQESSSQDLAFNNDGTKMYIVGSGSNTVYQYSLSTGFNLSTASYDSVSFSAASQEGSVRGMTFKSDGTKMYVTGALNDSVYQYSLSTAFDISTATYDNESFSLASQTTAPNGITFSDNGTKLYMVTGSGDKVFQYSTGSTLATATLDLSTGSVFEVTPTANTQVSLSNPAASGTVSSSTLLLSTSATAYTITWDSSIKWSGGTAPDSPAASETDVYYFSTRDGGTSYIANIAIDGAK